MLACLSRAQGGRKGVMIWSKKKVDDDAKAYREKIEWLQGEFPSFENDRRKLSHTLDQNFGHVLQKSGKKQPVQQEIDEISKIYAHSEFVNDLFHDELTRIKDLCLANLVAPVRAAASSHASSTQIHAASTPSLSSVSLSASELTRSVSAQSRTGALQTTRFTSHLCAHTASVVQ